MHKIYSKAPQTNTIVEEAVLEDLLEEASLELEVAKAGPMDKNQKSKLLRQLATNEKTAQHFEVKLFINRQIILALSETGEL